MKRGLNDASGEQHPRGEGPPRRDILTILRYRQLLTDNPEHHGFGDHGCNVPGNGKDSPICETRAQAGRPRTLQEQVTVGANTSLRGREGQELRDAPDASVGHAAVMMTTPECAYRPLNRGSSLNCCPVAALSVKELRSPDLEEDDGSSQALKYEASEDETQEGNDLLTAQRGTSISTDRKCEVHETPYGEWRKVMAEVGKARWADISDHRFPVASTLFPQ